MQQLRRFLLCDFSVTVITRSRGDICMPSHFLHRGDVGAGVEQIADKRMPKIMLDSILAQREDGTSTLLGLRDRALIGLGDVEQFQSYCRTRTTDGARQEENPQKLV